MNTYSPRVFRSLIIVVLFTLFALLIAMPANGQVTRIGCAGGDFGDDCSLAELLETLPPYGAGCSGGTPWFCAMPRVCKKAGSPAAPPKGIQINDTLFHGFVWFEGLLVGNPPISDDLDQVRVEPIESNLHPGIRLVATGDAFERSGLLLNLPILTFHVCDTRGESYPFVGRHMIAKFGAIEGHDLGEGEDSSVFIKDRMVINLVDGQDPPVQPGMTAGQENEATLTCNASEGAPSQTASCANWERRDSHPEAARQNFFFQNHDMSPVIDLFFTAEPGGNAELESLDYRMELLNAGITAVPDVGDGDAPELGVVMTGSLNGYVKDGKTGNQIKKVPFNANRRLLDTDVADINGQPALVILGEDFQGRGWVEVRDAVTGVSLQDVWYLLGERPIALAVLPDQTGNNVSELAVLVTRDSDSGRAWVHVKDALQVPQPGDPATKTFINSVWFEAGHTPLDLEFVSDVTANGAAELAVLTTRKNDNRAWVHVKDSKTGNFVSKVWFPNGFVAKDLAVISNLDMNPGPELAVLQQKVSDGRAWVHLKDALSGAFVKSVWLDLGFTPMSLKIVPDLDNNTGDELAVLMTKDTDGRAWVYVRDAFTGTYISNVWFTNQGGFEPIDFAVLPDFLASPASELAVLGVKAGMNVQVETKDALTRAFISLISFP